MAYFTASKNTHNWKAELWEIKDNRLSAESPWSVKSTTKMAWKVLCTDQQSTCGNTRVTFWAAQSWVVQLKEEDSQEAQASSLQNVGKLFPGPQSLISL